MMRIRNRISANRSRYPRRKMVAPILTPALVSLRTGFNKIAQNRDKSSDGWIGDLRHQQSASGHNPDETGNAERHDADNIDEVRAIDVDKDLNEPGITMLKCIQKILATPADRNRLIYIIFMPPGGVPTIWTKSSGWNSFRYNGSNPHDHHAHFSGDPASDNDDRPWSIEQFIVKEVPEVSKAEVLDALDDATPWVSQGVAAAAKAKGWGDKVSTRALLEYVFSQTILEDPDAHNALMAAVLNVDEEVATKLGAGLLSPEQMADVLRPLLGSNAAAVGRILAGT